MLIDFRKSLLVSALANFARIPVGKARECTVDIRGKRLSARIVRPPFVRRGQACEGTTGGAAVSGPATAAVSTAVEPPAAVSVEPEPAPAREPAVAAFDAEATYQASCFACHGTGAAGAPLPGEQEVWDVIMEKGMAAVMTNVIDGLNAMPARGLCATCSDDDLQALVDYMISQ